MPETFKLGIRAPRGKKALRVKGFIRCHFVDLADSGSDDKDGGNSGDGSGSGGSDDEEDDGAMERPAKKQKR